MDHAKIGLSPDELNLVTNAGVILTKNAIIEKSYQLFGDLSMWMQVELKPLSKELHDALVIPPKISRGENYLGLPYVILDYPRYFRPHDIFAIRTMFWWGNFISMTLHLKGNFREHYHQRIVGKYEQISAEGFYAGIGEDEWDHHFGEDNFMAVNMIDMDEWLALYEARSFTKLSLKFPLEQWNDMPYLLTGAFQKILSILKK
jgi:hypothetical protein